MNNLPWIIVLDLTAQKLKLGGMTRIELFQCAHSQLLGYRSS